MIIRFCRFNLEVNLFVGFRVSMFIVVLIVFLMGKDVFLGRFDGVGVAFFLFF